MVTGVTILLFMVVFASLYTEAKKPSSSATESGVRVPEGTVKTVKDAESGVLIDCIEISKQPSLLHPLLRNHTLEMNPSSSYPVGQGAVKANGMRSDQPRSKYGQCPRGTIPIIRAQKGHSPITVQRTPALIVNQSLDNANAMRGLENAHVFKTGESYTGVHAYMNLWEPAVEANGQSNARIWLMATDQSDDVDIISAGWMVDPNWVYPNQTVPIIFWASSKHRRQGGCYNFQCGGFVQITDKFTLGHPFVRTSTYDGTQYETQFSIYRNPRSGNWWLRMMNVEIGYWPSELFTALRKSARTVVWGGHVISPSTAPGTEHAKTQMGSGRFPGEGFGRSCFFRDLWYTTPDRPTSPRLVDPRHLHRFATRPQCYDVIVAEDDEWGVHIYFGGPGYSNRCRYN